MKLTFLGADHEVTGSCALLEAAGSRFLIDCGMEQGKDVYENTPLPLAPGELDGILVTHAHIDHTGRIPLLVQQGFKSPIYATEATAQLCDVMLRDSAHIQEFEAEWKNRKGKRAGAAPVVPLYTVEDAQNAMKLFAPKPYRQRIRIADGIEIRFTDVGHLLGSASIEIWVTENGKTEKIAFSGDIGNQHQPLIRDPEYLEDADYAVMESTYGDRLHGPKPDYVGELARILQETFDRGGNVVIPSFAVGRTQEILYFLREIKERGLVKGHADFPVYVDSPLAIETTHIFTENMYQCFDDAALALVRQGVNPIAVPGLRLTVTSDESRLINADRTPKVILSASGMCEAGRIRHHLKHNLWRPECTVLFVGYQAQGTLGRALVEGAKEVRLFGEDIGVAAQIRQLNGMSGHADRDGLLRWIHAFREKPRRVFIVHGEDEVENVFAAGLAAEGYAVTAPYNGAQWDLAADQCLYEGNRTRIQPKTPAAAGAPADRGSAVYARLTAMGQRLLSVIARSKGGANKDLARFADQVQALCDRWDR